MEDVQQLQRTLGALLLFLPVIRQTEEGGGQIVPQGLVQTDLDVVDDAQFLEQADVLEGTGHAHAVDLVGLFAGGGHPVDQDGAAGGLVNVGQQVEDGGLARAVQAGDLVAADHQVEAVHSGQAAEVDAQLTHIEDRLFVLVAVGQEAAGGDTVQSCLELTHGLRPPFPSCGTAHRS